MGIHLGHFMESIGSKTGNQGGGHDGAAGLNGKGKADPVLDLCMNDMATILEEKLGVERTKDRYDHGRRRGNGRSRNG
jgi:nanoRNase/pAp phosphatase (c-di-AMP/oligoRNAs hydrolase)